MHRPQHLVADRTQSLAVLRPLGVAPREAADHATPAMVVAEVQRTVFSDDSVDGPEARDQVAPARGAAGHRDHQQPRPLQALQRAVRGRAKATCGRDRAVDVEQHSAQAGKHGRLRIQ